MTDLLPGQDVTVSGSSGGVARLIYVRGNSARVRFAVTGKERTVELSRVTPKRESKALSVGPLADLMDMANVDEPTAKRIVAACAPAMRPVPKTVTLRSEPYLAYVRKHPCCLCGASPSEAHHWSHHGGVMGSKVDDYRTVPLCQEHHRYWHDHGTLPEMDREYSEAALLREQAWLLRAWLDSNTVHYGDQVDALIRAIGGADA